MLDFLLGVYLAGLAVRGWVRGLVRELMDLAGLVLGTLIAFRLSAPLGRFLTDRFGATPEWGRIGAGVALFLLFAASLAVVAHYLARAARLPGLTLVNRLLGAGVATAWGMVLVLVLVTVADALPLGESASQAVSSSTVVAFVAGPDSLSRRLVAPLTGDAVAAAGALRRLVGGERVVPAEGERVELTVIDPERVRADPAAAAAVVELINADRLGAGEEPLRWSDGLSRVALDRALAMYRAGYVERRPSPEVLAHTREVGLLLSEAAEMVGLAATDRAAHVGIAEAENSAVTGPQYDRVGVAVVRGPLGVMVVEVYGR